MRRRGLIPFAAIGVIVQSDPKLANPAGAKLNAQTVARLAWESLDGAKAGAMFSGRLGYPDCIGALVGLRYYDQIRKRLEASPFMQDPFRELAVRIQPRKSPSIANSSPDNMLATPKSPARTKNRVVFSSLSRALLSIEWTVSGTAGCSIQLCVLYGHNIKAQASGPLGRAALAG